MANQEHLDILKQGVEVWNKWREAFPDIEPDLSEDNIFWDFPDLPIASNADPNETDFNGIKLSGINFSKSNLHYSRLSRADLSEANLSEANLSKADLTSSNLSEAKLSETRLTRTLLIDANLYKAELSEADLYGTVLYRANLTEANLSWARLESVDLTEANLQRAIITGVLFKDVYLDEADMTGIALAGTWFSDIDLRHIKGLEVAVHQGPSHIDTHTISRSRGNIPEAFLRGVGVDDTFIEYIHSLVRQPIQYYSCFISYSSKDEAFSKRLYADLQSNNVRCWFASEDMKTGDVIRRRIDEAIRVHDKLLLVLSQHSVESSWVEKEVETAFEKERQQKRHVLFPVRLDDVVMQTSTAWAADIRRMRHITNFTDWKDHDTYQKAFARLLRDLKAET